MSRTPILTFLRYPAAGGRVLLLLTGAFAFAVAALAQSEPDLARKIEGKLMAPCCWSSPVSQHQSEAATKIKAGIREQLAAGKTEQQILDFYVAEYGERILASPRASGFNLLAWALPALFTMAGGVVVWMFLQRSTSRKAAGAAATEVPRIADPDLQARIDAEVRSFDS